MTTQERPPANQQTDQTITYTITQTIHDVGTDPRLRYNAVTEMLETLSHSHGFGYERTNLAVEVDGTPVTFDPLGHDMGHHPGHDLPWRHADGTTPDGAHGTKL